MFDCVWHMDDALLLCKEFPVLLAVAEACAMAVADRRLHEARNTKGAVEGKMGLTRVLCAAQVGFRLFPRPPR